MFEERDKDKSKARKRFEEEMQGFSELTVETLKRWKRKNGQ